MKIVHFTQIDSTNAQAHRIAANASEKQTACWILADMQSAGRGRRQRKWESPRGNLMSSLYLPTPMPLAHASQYAFIAALATYDMAAHFLKSDVALSLKWPNDLLLDGQKIAGLLLETAPASNKVIAFLVIGIGVNLAVAPSDTPYPAAHLGLDAPPTPRAALIKLASCFEDWLAVFARDGFVPLRAAWMARAHAIGTRLSLRSSYDDTQPLEGVYTGLDEAGALCLKTDAGATHILSAGDVFFASTPASEPASDSVSS